jgi:hypothetical protein
LADADLIMPQKAPLSNQSLEGNSHLWTLNSIKN